MSIEYAEDKDLELMVRRLIDLHFRALNDLGVVVLSLMKINVSEDGENKHCKGCPIRTKKVGPAERVFIKDSAHIILLMDYTTWNESDEVQRKFWVDHGLRNIHAEKHEKSVVITTVKPDIVVHSGTIELYGAPFDSLLDLREHLAKDKPALKVVNSLQQKVDAQTEQESEVPEPEPDLPPPRRVKKVAVPSE